MLQAIGFDPSTLKEGAIETLDTGDLAGPLQFTGLTHAYAHVLVTDRYPPFRLTP